MLLIFSKPVLIRHPWQFDTLVLLHGCPICSVLLCCIIMQGTYRYRQTQKVQHLSWLKASALAAEDFTKSLVVKKCYDLYLRLVTLSSG